MSYMTDHITKFNSGTGVKIFLYTTFSIKSEILYNTYCGFKISCTRAEYWGYCVKGGFFFKNLF